MKKVVILMSTNDYVRFITEQFVNYLDMPKDERRQERLQKKISKEPLSVRLFGILPTAFLLMLRRKK